MYWYLSMVQAHGEERYKCETLEEMTQKFIPDEKQNFSCWIRIDQNEGNGILNLEGSTFRVRGFRFGSSCPEAFRKSRFRRITVLVSGLLLYCFPDKNLLQMVLYEVFESHQFGINE